MRYETQQKHKPLLLSKREVHEILSISLRTVDYLTARNVLHPIRIGRKVMFKTTEIEYLAEVGYSGKVSDVEFKKPILKPDIQRIS